MIPVNRDCEFVSEVLERAAFEAPFWLPVLWRVRGEHGIDFHPDEMIRSAHWLSEDLYMRFSKEQPLDDFVNALDREESEIIQPSDYTASGPDSKSIQVHMTGDNANRLACRLIAYAATKVQISGRAWDALRDERSANGQAN